MAVTGFMAAAGGAAFAARPAPPSASTCVACHGQEGVSANPLWPNLAGQQESYLVKQMKAFRDGERSDPLMSPVARMLSDHDIDELAAYFAGLKVK
jgi:cytochrome c553